MKVRNGSRIGMLQALMVLLAGICLVGATACHTGPSTSISSSDAGHDEIANPMVEVDGPDDIVIQTGLHMSAPAGATGIDYYVIDGDLGQIDFTLGGVKYTYRQLATDSDEDISGLYYTWDTEKDIVYSGCTYHIAFTHAGVGYASYHDDSAGIEYSVSVEEDANEQMLRSIATTLFFG